MSGLRVRRRRAAEGRIGAPLGQAYKSVGRVRTHRGHDRPLSLRLERSRSPSRRSRAICVSERQAHHGRQGAWEASTRLLANRASILIVLPAAVRTRPHCGYGCGDD